MIFDFKITSICLDDAVVTGLRSPARLAFGVGARPILEFIGEEFAIEIGNALRHAGLGVGDGLVVNGRADFFEEEVEQESRGHIPDGIQVLFEVALHGGNGFGALLFREFKGDHSGDSFSKNRF